MASDRGQKTKRLPSRQCIAADNGQNLYRTTFLKIAPDFLFLALRRNILVILLHYHNSKNYVQTAGRTSFMIQSLICKMISYILPSTANLKASSDIIWGWEICGPPDFSELQFPRVSFTWDMASCCSTFGDLQVLHPFTPAQAFFKMNGREQ